MESTLSRLAFVEFRRLEFHAAGFPARMLLRF
jgi:hypothetical protein